MADFLTYLPTCWIDTAFANVFFIQQKKLLQATAQTRQKKPKAYGINTDPAHKAIFYSVSFWFFICLRWWEAYKNYTLCTSSFVSSPAGASFQYALSAVPSCPQCLSCRIGFSAGISGGSQFIISIGAPGFLPLAAVVGLFIAFHQVAAGLVAFPFRVGSK